jgi:hypothetical protein
MCDVILQTETKLAALRLRMPDLEGKEHKRERTRVNKEIHALENDDSYVDAVREGRTSARASTKEAEAVAWAAKMEEEKQREVAQAQRATSCDSVQARLHYRSQVTNLVRR